MAEAKLHCPHCNEVIAVATEALGTTIPCPHCEASVKLPAPPKEAKEATFVQEAAPAAPAPPTPAEEVEVFDTSPRLLGYIGRTIWSGLWIAAGVAAWRYLAGLGTLGDLPLPEQVAEELGKYELSENAAYLGLIISFFGVMGLLRVFIESMFNRYRLTTQRLLLRTGFIARHTEEIELFRIKDVSLTQGVLHRLVGAGNVKVLSTDDTTPWVVLRGVARPEEVKEKVREHALASRQRHGMRAAEFIQS